MRLLVVGFLVLAALRAWAQDPATPLKPRVYNHVISHEDSEIPSEQEARDLFASSYNVIDITDPAPYEPAKAIAGDTFFAAGGLPNGRVFILYVITVDGRPTSPHVVRSSDEKLNSVALRLLNTLRFEPAKLNGVPIPTIAGVPFEYIAPPTPRA